MPELLTVGHSTHPLDAFLALVSGAGVEVVADVFTFDGWRVRHLMPSGKLDDHTPPPFAIRGDDGLPLYPAAGQDALFGLH